MQSLALGLKEKSLSFSSLWEFQTSTSSLRAPDPFLLLGDPGLLINLPRNWHSQNENDSRYFKQERKVKVKTKVKSCPIFCDPVNCSPPGRSIYGIFQARILEWLLFPSRGDLPNPGIELMSPTLQAHAITSETSGKPKQERSYYTYEVCIKPVKEPGAGGVEGSG